MPTIQPKIAVIIGITRLGGSYLADLLLEKGYQLQHQSPRDELQHQPDRSLLSRPLRD